MTTAASCFPTRVWRLGFQAFVLLACMASFCVSPVMADESPEEVVATRRMAFPHSRPGETETIKKMVDRKTGRVWVESESGTIRSYEQVSGMVAQEEDALRRKYGNLGEELRKIIDQLGDWDSVKVVVYVRMPPVKYLNKMEHSMEALEEQSRQLLETQPIVSLDDVSRAYGIQKESVLSKNAFITTVSKKQLESMMFDNAIASIERYVKHKPATLLGYTTFAVSAFNPAPLPSDSRGQGVHAATFEQGIWQSHFDALGNLNPDNIEINDYADEHSQWTFRFLWNAAPEATFYHHQSLVYHSQTAQEYLMDNAIETVSISYHRGTNPHDAEFLTMDEFAYRFPFPTFVNPTGNEGYEFEVNWQPYNAISVGNIRHREQRHYELAPSGCTATRNPDPEYGACIDGGSAPPCAGDREMPHIVAPGTSPTDAVVTDELGLLGPVSCGTSISAPTLNGIAADVISADSRMKYEPEKVRVALLLTAHNVDAGHWHYAVDDRDGTGVVSGSDAVRFAKEHVTVNPLRIFPVEVGLATGALSWKDTGTAVELMVRVPDVKPEDKHLRIVLTWDSIPDRDLNRNTLSDLDLLFGSDGDTYKHVSVSFDDNVEVVDVPSQELVPGRIYPAKVVVSQARVPRNAVTDYFFWAVGWTWVRDHAE